MAVGAPLTADDPAFARRRHERARRADPGNPMVALRLALARLQDGDPAAAAELFAELTERFDVAEAWLGLAASELQTGRLAPAAAAMHVCLSRHAATEPALRLAASIAAAAGASGWCAVDGRGWLHADAAAEAVLDGVVLRRQTGRPVRVPPGCTLQVACGGIPVLGSPIDLATIAAVEGFVETQAGGLSGWAWHPHDPGRNPAITITGVGAMTLRRLRGSADDMRPLARPREFAVLAADLPPGMLHVIGADGRDLLGSPLDPGLEQRSAAGLAEEFRPVWADVVGPPATARVHVGPVDVVVPVHGDRVRTLACLDSVLAALPEASRLHVVDDASPDVDLTKALDALAAAGRIQLLRLPRNRGFPAAANAGVAAAAGRDVVLLNSDTLTPPGWLEALTAAARSAPDIGTACPLSNEATILSYPDRRGGNPLPDLHGTARLAARAARANGAGLIDIPTAVGSCMFIRRDCLDQVGPFREDVFAQGYGEEVDFCLRARHRGWRHVAAAGAYVAHAGGASFGMARRHLQTRNAAVLERLHPGYDAMVAAWNAADPLGPARRRMDARHWRTERRARAVVLVTHAGGGGVERVVAARCAASRAVGVRPIVLRPDGGAVVVGDGETPNLRYAMPNELPALVRLLRAERPTHVELHHMMGHDPALLGLAAQLGVPHEVHVHDYAWFCPQVALVPLRAYCGEPSLHGCEACVADHGAKSPEAIPVADLVARSASVLAAASRVVAPAADVATRLRRHFPGVRAEVRPWEDDGAIPPPPVPMAIGRVCVIGGIGVEKGYNVLLGCLRDVARRSLPLAFSLVGHSLDDERLLDAGPIAITGCYGDEEVGALIRAQTADVAFLPSIWPETWCFTLGHAWRAGLQAVVFDLGAPAERVRRFGWGWLLPLGLPPPAINDWLLRYAAPARRPMLAPDAGQSHSRLLAAPSSAAI